MFWTPSLVDVDFNINQPLGNMKIGHELKLNNKQLLKKSICC